MAKNCCVCGKPLGMFSDKTVLKDGVLCPKCQKEGGIGSVGDMQHFTTAQIVKTVAERRDIVRSFQKTNTFGRISVDLTHRAFKIDGNLYLFGELLSYAYYEHPKNLSLQVKDGKSNGAAIGGTIGGLSGGLIGGAIGAAVGGKIGSYLATCDQMYINIVLQGALKGNVRLKFISEKTRVSSQEYAVALKEAQDCLEALRLITEQNEQQKKPKEVEASRREEKKTVFVQKEHLTASDIEKELETYQRMLRCDLITQEEYDQKKKQLLSMM